MSTPESTDRDEQGLVGQPSSSVESSGSEEDITTDPCPFSFAVAQPSLLAQRLLRLQASRSHLPPATRRKREMTPADKKDASYWDKRRKNNAAAKRSREKRRLNDLMIEGQLLALSEENSQLRAEVLTLQYHISLGRDSGHANANLSVPTATMGSPLHYPTPALFQAGFCGHGRGNPASILGVQQQELTRHPPVAIISSSMSAARPNGLGLQPQSPHARPQSGHSIYQQNATRVSPKAFDTEATGSRAAAEAEKTAAHQQVSSSNDLPSVSPASSHSTSSTPTFLPISTGLPLPTTLSPTSHPHQAWLIPRLSHPVVRNNLLLPLGPPCLTPPQGLYPSLPLYMPTEGREEPVAGLHQGADFPRGFRGRFCSLSAEVAQLRRYLSSDRC